MNIVTAANHSLDIELFNASGSIMALDSVMKGLAELVKIKNELYQNKSSFIRLNK
ncbi:hypothetical protein MPH61_06315 [Peribacillus muralis]|uniref:hypothetical protein n=1 Tax=Peribacillus muralis TaxID=264697 RepID=UPI001F4EA84E|nr:hypothetical protein [Peribacillus muralis]MCK1992213.1 hypothetical protein [Peribacillus muralis]MCK2012769.1 hypothetical protein [Peribacillus muralis]